MNPEIEALIRKSHESLGAARSLIRDGYFDFAASRAYYSMFYVADSAVIHLHASAKVHNTSLNMDTKAVL